MAAVLRTVVLDSTHEHSQQTLQGDSHKNPTISSQNEVSCPVSDQLPSKVPTVSPCVEIRSYTGNSEHGQTSENRQVDEVFPIKDEPVDSASESESGSESEPEGNGISDPDFEGSDDEGTSR